VPLSDSETDYASPELKRKIFHYFHFGVYRDDADGFLNPLNAELNHTCYTLALLGSATIGVVSRKWFKNANEGLKYTQFISN
jgi:hypothetical protein